MCWFVVTSVCAESEWGETVAQLSKAQERARQLEEEAKQLQDKLNAQQQQHREQQQQLEQRVREAEANAQAAQAQISDGKANGVHDKAPKEEQDVRVAVFVSCSCVCLQGKGAAPETADQSPADLQQAIQVGIRVLCVSVNAACSLGTCVQYMQTAHDQAVREKEQQFEQRLAEQQRAFDEKLRQTTEEQQKQQQQREQERQIEREREKAREREREAHSQQLQQLQQQQQHQQRPTADHAFATPIEDAMAGLDDALLMAKRVAASKAEQRAHDERESRERLQQALVPSFTRGFFSPLFVCSNNCLR